jgi:hypothetical protein
MATKLWRGAARDLLGHALFLAFLGCAACGEDGTDNPTQPGADASDDTSADVVDDAQVSEDAGEPSRPDPFEPQDPPLGGLVNVSADLEEVLERGELEGACDRYFGGQRDERTHLLCGKWMFFYEGFDGPGVPGPIFQFLLDEMHDVVGPGYGVYGQILDPSSERGWPLGWGRARPFGANIEGVAQTCGACHFGRLPDGRYSVGAPNHEYDYGGHFLSFGVFPSVALLGGEAGHDPQAVEELRPLLDALEADPARRDKLLQAVLPLASAGPAPTINAEVEGNFARWTPGTMDVFMAPLEPDDGVNIPNKIISLWGLPSAQDAERYGMPDAMLSWVGTGGSVEDFVNFFVRWFGDPEVYTAERVEPLVAFLLSLRAPQNPSPPPSDAVERGAALFRTAGCLECHGGPRGSGVELYGFDELGTDPQAMRFLDPDLDGEACCGVDGGEGALTHKIKSPRLVGLWGQRRFLHNGSLPSLEALFCLEPRPPSGEPPYQTGGHMQSCDGLSEQERQDLLAYMKSL